MTLFSKPGETTVIDVQHVDGRTYFVWLDEHLLTAIGRGNPETLIKAVLTSAFAAKYPELFPSPHGDVPF